MSWRESHTVTQIKIKSGAHRMTSIKTDCSRRVRIRAKTTSKKTYAVKRFKERHDDGRIKEDDPRVEGDADVRRAVVGAAPGRVQRPKHARDKQGHQDVVEDVHDGKRVHGAGKAHVRRRARAAKVVRQADKGRGSLQDKVRKATGKYENIPRG